MALAFAAAFVAGLLWLLPLRLFVGAEALRGVGASASGVRGRVWDGVLEDASVRGTQLGDLRVGVRVLPLLVGVRRIGFEGAGLSGAVLQGRTQGVEKLSGALPLSVVAPGSPLAGTVRLKDVTLVFDGDGCRRAGGQASAEAAFGAGPPVRLAGGVSCRGEAGVAALRSTGSSPSVDATLRVEGDGGYRLTSAVAATDPGTRTVLQLAGFQPGAAGLTRTDEGRLLR